MHLVPQFHVALQPCSNAPQHTTAQERADTIANTDGTREERSRKTEVPANVPSSASPSTSGWLLKFQHRYMQHSTGIRVTTKAARQNNATNRILAKNTNGTRKNLARTQKEGLAVVWAILSSSISQRASFYRQNGSQGTKRPNHDDRFHL